jgi:hypothetical protein
MSCEVCGRDHPVSNVPRKRLKIGQHYRVVYAGDGGRHRGFTGTFTGISSDEAVAGQRGYGFTLASDAIIDLETAQPVPIVTEEGKRLATARGTHHLIWQLDLIGLGPA